MIYYSASNPARAVSVLTGHASASIALASAPITTCICTCARDQRLCTKDGNVFIEIVILHDVLVLLLVMFLVDIVLVLVLLLLIVFFGDVNDAAGGWFSCLWLCRTGTTYAASCTPRPWRLRASIFVSRLIDECCWGGWLIIID